MTLQMYHRLCIPESPSRAPSSPDHPETSCAHSLEKLQRTPLFTLVRYLSTHNPSTIPPAAPHYRTGTFSCSCLWDDRRRQHMLFSHDRMALIFFFLCPSYHPMVSRILTLDALPVTISRTRSPTVHLLVDSHLCSVPKPW